ncbi:MAG: hypothetical protein ACRCWJ_00075 [Casimicrobium sp.]
MKTIVYALHDRLFGTLRELAKDRQLRNRFLGGAIITGAVVTILNFSLPLAFMFAHGIFDYEFAANHYFSIVATLVFLSSLAIIGLLFLGVPMISLETRRNRQEQSGRRPIWYSATEALRGGFSLLKLGILIGFVGAVIWAIWKENIAIATVAIASSLVALLLGLRWIIRDALVSNYLTSCVGIVGLLLIATYQSYVAGLYQDLVLRPRGLSGVRVEIIDERGTKTSACLLLLAPQSLWVIDGQSLSAYSRDKVAIVIPTPPHRKKERCETLNFGPRS